MKLYVFKDRTGVHVANHKPIWDKEYEIFTARKTDTQTFRRVGQQFAKGLKKGQVREITAFICKGK